MKNRLAVLFWVDVVLAVNLVALLVTSVVLKFALPHGSGGGGQHRGARAAQTLVDLTRHQWGDIHFWLGVALLCGVLLHVALHWGWVTASLRRFVWSNR